MTYWQVKDILGCSPGNYRSTKGARASLWRGTISDISYRNKYEYYWSSDEVAIVVYFDSNTNAVLAAGVGENPNWTATPVTLLKVIGIGG
jgi:hypothetical protein